MDNTPTVAARRPPPPLYMVGSFRPGSFRREEWNPHQIVAQILAVQSVFYVVTAVIWWALALLTGRHFSTDTLLSWEVAVERADAMDALEARGAGGASASWAVSLAAGVLVAVCCGLALVPLVGRAKQCWDFAATAYVLHVLCCSFYTRFPSGPGSGEWWGRQVLAATLMSLTGEFFCMKYELREISVATLAGRSR